MLSLVDCKKKKKIISVGLRDTTAQARNLLINNRNNSSILVLFTSTAYTKILKERFFNFCYCYHIALLLPTEQ